MEAVWYVLLAVVLVLFIVMHAVVLPRRFFRGSFETPVAGRGVKVINEKGGTSIVYEPDMSIKKYIGQYIVSERGGKKRLIMRVADYLRFISVDVALFDSDNRMFDMLTVEDVISKKGYSDVIELPNNTAYVTLHLNAADDKKFAPRRKGGISGKNWAAFLMCCALCELFTVFVSRLCIAKLYGGIYWESFVLSAEGNLIAAAICVAIVALNAAFMFIYVRFKVADRGRRG